MSIAATVSINNPTAMNLHLQLYSLTTPTPVLSITLPGISFWWLPLSPCRVLNLPHLSVNML
jgi:hypothetical protein